MQLSEYFILSLFVIMGAVSLLASLFNADWFLNSRQAATFVQWLGRPGARIFYSLLGFALIACGIAGFLTWE
ncbi:MAG: immunity 17 family protein [Tannerellaceae bacterium]|nr:immunity 17 family protein [Tannerellaceae bacterium]